MSKVKVSELKSDVLESIEELVNLLSEEGKEEEALEKIGEIADKCVCLEQAELAGLAETVLVQGMGKLATSETPLGTHLVTLSDSIKSESGRPSLRSIFNLLKELKSEKSEEEGTSSSETPSEENANEEEQDIEEEDEESNDSDSEEGGEVEEQAKTNKGFKWGSDLALQRKEEKKKEKERKAARKFAEKMDQSTNVEETKKFDWNKVKKGEYTG